MESGRPRRSLTFVDEATFLVVFPELLSLPSEVRAQIAKEAIYANYLGRQEADVARLKKAEATVIPTSFPYEGISGLSSEVLQKLNAIQPQTIAAAAKIEGMTPAALNALIFALKHNAVAKLA